MKRTSVISAVALIAVLGSSAAGFASDTKDENKGMKKHGQHERMAGGEMRPDFATLDADGDGQVTQAEMDAFKAARFAELDADGSGTVSAEEMAAHHDAKQEERKAKRAAKRTEGMISKMDTDGDGELSLEEMSGEKHKTPFERMDKNGDGALSEDEMNAVGPRGHGKGDRDK